MVFGGTWDPCAGGARDVRIIGFWRNVAILLRNGVFCASPGRALDSGVETVEMEGRVVERVISGVYGGREG